MVARNEGAKLVGTWSGHNQLWLGPGESVRESPTRATITSAANGQFLMVAYTWADQGQPHDGVLVLRLAAEPGPVDMVWLDSFHTMRGFMQFVGQPTPDGSWNATTTWSVGEGPEWGWRIALAAPSEDELVIRMFIATPTGEESPAVESRYRRERVA